MTVGEALILYALVVGIFGPAALRRMDWPLRAPRLGAAAMLAIAWSVVLALLLAGLTVVLPASALTMDIGHLLGACLSRLRAAYASPGGAVVVIAGQALSLSLTARIACVAAGLTLAGKTERRRHQLLIRLAGHRLPNENAVVLDTPATAAYCIAGRRPTVIVTSGVMGVLSAQQLDAVLAHEEAHLRARHHRWLAAGALAARSLPFIPLLRQTPAQLARLLEMDADEAAAHEHEPRVLASALVVVGTATPSGGHDLRPRRGTATNATGGDAAARIRRLLRPPEELPRRRRVLARAGVVAVTSGPVLLAVMPGVLALR
jgi:Zn-dependent protease with chaperone function